MAFPGTGKIWMNGSLVDWADARIHVASHVVHYGSGVFEGARCYDTASQGPAVFRLGPHIRRLIDSARVYRMESPYDQATIEQAVLDLIRLNGFRACIRPSTTAEQVRAIVMEGLKKNPSERRYPAFNVIAKYLSEAFPCKSPAPARGRTPPRVRT